MSCDPLPVEPAPALAATSADREHLKLLAIFHFVIAAFIALFGCFGSIYVFMGILMTTGQFDSPNPPPPQIGWIVAGVGLFIMALLWTLAAVVVLSGRRLLQHRGRLFCMIVAGLLCLNFPFGTALGAFTLAVLSRPGVRELFGDA